MVARTPAPLVLVADAEFYICRVLEAKLSKDNQFRVITATTGVDALQASLEQSFDILLWDMRLRDTLDLLPRLRALSPNAALFLMTTDDRPSLNSELSRLDVAGVLIKPFGLDTLVEQLRLALENPLPTAAPAAIDLSRVGQRLTLISPGGRCVTRVLERNLDTFAVVGAPRVETPADFSTGVKVQVQVRGEDALYSFDSRLLRLQAQPILRWELRLPSVIRRQQRRKHARLPVHLPIRLKNQGRAPEENAPLHTADEADGTPGAAPSVEAAESAAGFTEDLSLGGLALISERAAAVGQEVLFDLEHPALHTLEGHGRIVRQNLLPDTVAPGGGTGPRYQIAIQFTDLDAEARRHLRALLGPRGE